MNILILALCFLGYINTQGIQFPSSDIQFTSHQIINKDTLLTTFREMGYTVKISQTVNMYILTIGDRKTVLSIGDNIFTIVACWESRQITSKGPLLVWCNNWSHSNFFMCSISADMSPCLSYSMFYPITSQALELFLISWTRVMNQFAQQLAERLDIFPIKKAEF